MFSAFDRRLSFLISSDKTKLIHKRTMIWKSAFSREMNTRLSGKVTNLMIMMGFFGLHVFSNIQMCYGP